LLRPASWSLAAEPEQQTGTDLNHKCGLNAHERHPTISVLDKTKPRSSTQSKIQTYKESRIVPTTSESQQF